jgi:hypothetical protein
MRCSQLYAGRSYSIARWLQRIAVADQRAAGVAHDVATEAASASVRGE